MSALATVEGYESREIQHVSWREFLDGFRSPSDGWRQGEHVTMVGPTGVGKTTLATTILPLRDYVIVLATKPKDPLIDDLPRHSRRNSNGYRVGMEWPTPAGINRYIYWPPASRMANLPEQRARFRRVFEDVYESGGWTLYMDEIRYLAKYLGLEPEIQTLYLQARSLRVSLVAGTQRPFHIPLEAYDQATHLMFWRDSDQRNLRRLSELNDVDAAQIRAVVRSLPRHEFLYVNTRTGEMLRTKAEVE